MNSKFTLKYAILGLTLVGTMAFSAFSYLNSGTISDTINAKSPRSSLKSPRSSAKSPSSSGSVLNY